MEMEAAECVSAICSMKFKDDDTEYFVVGTAFVQDEVRDHTSVCFSLHISLSLALSLSLDVS